MNTTFAAVGDWLSSGAWLQFGGRALAAISIVVAVYGLVRLMRAFLDRVRRRSKVASPLIYIFEQVVGYAMLVVGVLARRYGKLNYLTLCGLLAGSMTDPPALAFANGMHPTSGASALSYATVYPLVMFLRIISPQLLAILLWAGA